MRTKDTKETVFSANSASSPPVDLHRRHIVSHTVFLPFRKTALLQKPLMWQLCIYYIYDVVVDDVYDHDNESDVGLPALNSDNDKIPILIGLFEYSLIIALPPI